MQFLVSFFQVFFLKFFFFSFENDFVQFELQKQFSDILLLPFCSLKNNEIEFSCEILKNQVNFFFFDFSDFFFFLDFKIEFN